MTNMRIITSILVFFSVIFFSSGCVKKESGIIETAQEIKTQEMVKKATPTPKVAEKKYDLYSLTPYDLPLFSIIQIAKLPDAVKSSVDKVLEQAQGFYLLSCDKDKVFIILQNPIFTPDTYPRHELQFAVIDMEGKVNYHTAGYGGVKGEVSAFVEPKDDDWFFDETIEPHRPLKHISYDEKGKVKFIEFWNYDESEPIKYQMNDGHKKVVSILRETQDNDSNLRREHVFYDNEGKTKMSLSVNFDGANISRLTFYNSHDSIDSLSIMSEYSDGLKVKELVYNEDYQLINTVTSEYVNGIRKNIKLFDSEGTELNKISA